jgi:hypothetical protein
MPIRSYFATRDGRKLTMPRAGEGVINADGLVLHGDVLTGKLSVPEAFAREAFRPSRSAPGKRVGPDDYDPVLRAHLRIVE